MYLCTKSKLYGIPKRITKQINKGRSTNYGFYIPTRNSKGLMAPFSAKASSESQ